MNRDEGRPVNAIYPRRRRTRDYHLDRPWLVRYIDLVYDNGTSSWTKGYRTYVGARVAAWWHYTQASWGGGPVTIYPNEADHD